MENLHLAFRASGVGSTGGAFFVVNGRIIAQRQARAKRCSRALSKKNNLSLAGSTFQALDRRRQMASRPRVRPSSGRPNARTTTAPRPPKRRSPSGCPAPAAPPPTPPRWSAHGGSETRPQARAGASPRTPTASPTLPRPPGRTGCGAQPCTSARKGASLFARGEGGYAARKPDLRRQARFGRPSRAHGTANAAAGTGRAKALQIARECGRSGASPEGWDKWSTAVPALCRGKVVDHLSFLRFKRPSGV